MTVALLDQLAQGNRRSTPAFTDDTAAVKAAVDLPGWFTADGLGGCARRPHGPGYACPNPQHAQTGQSPPVSISQGREGWDVWRCHGCGIGGTPVDYLAAFHQVDTAEAFQLARQRLGMTPGTLVPPPPARRTQPPAPRPLPDPEADRITGDTADTVMARYLDHRGWPTGVVDRFGLTVVEHHGGPWIRHPYRSGGEVKWWQDRRAHRSEGAKWWNPPGATGCLHAVDLADTLAGDGLRFIVEGPADVITLDIAGFPALGIPGTANPQRWAPALRGFDVIIATDADTAGDQAAHQLGQALTAQRTPWCRLRPPDGHDLGAWSQQVDDLTDTLLDALEPLDWTVTT